MVIALIKSLRPIQWTKNLLLFAGVVFSLNILNFDYVLLSSAAFGIFCVIASGGYIINDLFDLPADRRHPEKSKRPMAAGELNPGIAGMYAGVLVVFGITAAFWLNRDFGLICLLYLTITLLYSWKLKNIVILDVLIIAAGFVIRAIAGTVVIDVVLSKWLLICTIFLALFLALGKRMNELSISKENQNRTRKILTEYSPNLLIQLISISASSTVIAYTLYTVDNLTVEKFGTVNLVYTVPFVIYGIFRYMYLIHKKNLGEYPEFVLFTDKSTLINIIFYLAVVFYILY